MENLMNDVERVLLTEEQVNSICKKIGEQLSKEYEGKNPIFIGFLKGSTMFLSELLKRVTIACQVDFMVASSYSGSSSTGNVIIKKDLDNDIKDRDIILVEDIVDTGYTLSKITDLLKKRNPKSIKVVTLLNKPSNRKVEFIPDYVGMEIPNEFIIGYGLDYNEKYRNLPIIGILKRSVYEK